MYVLYRTDAGHADVPHAPLRHNYVKIMLLGSIINPQIVPRLLMELGQNTFTPRIDWHMPVI